MIERLCKKCGRSFPQFNSMQNKCGLCMYNYDNKLKAKKPMKRIGKVGLQWIEDRKLWITNNPAKNGFWNCEYCGKKLDINNLTLDHMLSRGRHPDKRRDQTNLVPACYTCNANKGSKDYVKM